MIVINKLANSTNIYTVFCTGCSVVQGRLTPLHGWEINPQHLTLHLVCAENEGTILLFGPVWFGRGSLEPAP